MASATCAATADDLEGALRRLATIAAFPYGGAHQWDWLGIPDDTRAKRVGLLHGGGNVVVVALFIVAWLLRMNARAGAVEYAPNGLPIILEVIGLLLALVTGWLGGELVERLGVGVDEGAHLQAPNSLSGKPARTGAEHTRASAAARGVGVREVRSESDVVQRVAGFVGAEWHEAGRVLLGISLFWLALSMVFDGINTLVLPRHLLGLVDEASKATVLWAWCPSSV